RTSYNQSIDNGRDQAGADGRGRAAGGAGSRQQGEEEIRGEEVVGGGAVGVGHRGRQLRHLQKPHHGPVHRVPGEPGFGRYRRVQCRLGQLQPRLPLPLHLALAQDASGVPPRQPRVGVPEVRSLSGARRLPYPLPHTHAVYLSLHCLSPQMYLFSSLSVYSIRVRVTPFVVPELSVTLYPIDKLEYGSGDSCRCPCIL
ncbi:hypothetical protein PMAYCL1PPCAC_05609, partial [Pristionchus mayeri]